MFRPGLYFLFAFVAFFITAFAFSLLINSLFLRFSKNLGVRNHTEHMVRWNSSKPAFGGISFFIVLLISIAANTFIFEQNEHFHNLAFLGFICAATLAFLTGLFDDAFNTKVLLKLFTQIGCAVILIITGTYIHFFQNVWLDYLFTVVWVVGMMNSINMLDNMDGISSIVSVVIFIAILCISLLERNIGHPFTMILIGLIAAILGFLFFNWNPSKMYMGDTGSQFLGLVLAFTGIIFVWNYQDGTVYQPAVKRFFMIAVLFVLPLSDTLTVTVKRLSKRRSPFVGGKDHTTHHLSYMGLSDRLVAMVYLIIAVFAGGLMVYMACLTNWYWYYNFLPAAFFLVVFLALFIIGLKNQNKENEQKDETSEKSD